MSTAFARDADLLRSLVHRIDPTDPGAFNNLGVLYHTKGLHPEAVDAFLRALSIDPRMRTASRNLEIAAAVPGACDARLHELARRIESDADDVSARREEVRLLRLIGRIDEASRHCDALIAEHPDDAAALLERGLLEQRSGDLRRAHRWLERARNAAPHDALTRLHLAEVLYHRGSNEQALEILDELVGEDCGLADAYLLLGFVLGDMGRHEAAAAAAGEAARINPALATLQADLSLESKSALLPVAVAEGGELARYGLALAFRQRGYLDGARRELLRAREVGEDRRLVDHALAEIDIVSARSADAVEGYRALLEEFGDSARWWCEHGVALHQLGRVDEAAESYRRALRSDPRYALAYNNLGVALAHGNDAPAAREAFLRAIELDASLVRARLNLARWYVSQRDGLGAMALLRELTTFRAGDSVAWFELGAVMVMLGRDTEARHAFVRAIELDSLHAGARYGLADVLAIRTVRHAKHSMRSRCHRCDRNPASSSASSCSRNARRQRHRSTCSHSMPPSPWRER
jgi:superkiller protein 3